MQIEQPTESNPGGTIAEGYERHTDSLVRVYDTQGELLERGSFTAAAEELNLTQPAVTHQVREPERRFKVELKGHELV